MEMTPATSGSTTVSLGASADHMACDAEIARFRARAEAAEAKLAAIRELCEEAGTRTGGRVLAILGGKDLDDGYDRDFDGSAL